MTEKNLKYAISDIGDDLINESAPDINDAVNKKRPVILWIKQWSLVACLFFILFVTAATNSSIFNDNFADDADGSSQNGGENIPHYNGTDYQSNGSESSKSDEGFFVKPNTDNDSGFQEANPGEALTSTPTPDPTVIA